MPEPTGVVAVLAPQRSSLLGLVSVVAPALVTGNVVVAVCSEERPLPAVALAEVLATSPTAGAYGLAVAGTDVYFTNHQQGTITRASSSLPRRPPARTAASV